MKKKQNKFAKNLVIYTAVFIGAVLLLYFLNQLTKDTEPEHVMFDEVPMTDAQPLLGNEDAEVRIIKFGDYLCPGCQVWNAIFLPALEEEFIDDDEASFTFVNKNVFGESSRLAALAAESVRAQDEDAFWTYHNGLFTELSSSETTSESVTNEWLIEVAESYVSDIDLELLEEDLEQETYAYRLEEDTALGDQYDIRSTPTIIINNVLIKDPFDIQEIVTVIRSQLGTSSDE